jgi:hypothetical protein
MAVTNVTITGVSADEDELIFELGWEDDRGYFGTIEFRQYHNDDKIIADSEHTGKAFVIEVLHALGENLELNDL